MTKRQKSNLARTAIHMLNDKIMKFYMKRFFNSSCAWEVVNKPKEYVCGTSCCFAGYGPMALNNVRIKDEDWSKYVDRSFGCEDGSYLFEFLFSSDWPDDKKQAACRALAVLQRPTVVDDFEYKKTKVFKSSSFLEEYKEMYKTKYLSRISQKKLIEELEKYV